MSASVSEVQAHVDQILELLGTRIKYGQMVVHFSEFTVQRVETNVVHKPVSRPLRKPS